MSRSCEPQTNSEGALGIGEHFEARSAGDVELGDEVLDADEGLGGGIGAHRPSSTKRTVRTPQSSALEAPRWIAAASVRSRARPAT
jgi:hypothetical protein